MRSLFEGEQCEAYEAIFEKKFGKKKEIDSLVDIINNLDI